MIIKDIQEIINNKLKTPLTSIKEATSILNQGLYTSLDKQRELFSIIKDECDRLIS